jgi:hypothetical protein
MSSLPARILVFAIAAAAVALAATAPADARKRRQPHTNAVAADRVKVVTPRCRGGNLYPCGPVYFGDEYLGDDPDPNIRFQLYRDLGAHFGGEP